MSDSWTCPPLPRTSSSSSRAFAIFIGLCNNTAIAHSTVLDVVSIPARNKSYNKGDENWLPKFMAYYNRWIKKNSVSQQIMLVIVSPVPNITTGAKGYHPQSNKDPKEVNQ